MSMPINASNAPAATAQPQQQQPVVSEQVLTRPPVTPKPPKHKFGSISRGLSLRRLNFSSLSPPADYQPSPANNTCSNCKQKGGHFSNDCPYFCTYCRKKGHELKDCEPHCRACNGIGHHKRKRIEDPGEPEHPDPFEREWMAYSRVMQQMNRQRVARLAALQGPESNQYKVAENELGLVNNYLGLQRAAIIADAKRLRRQTL